MSDETSKISWWLKIGGLIILLVFLLAGGATI